MSTPAGDNLIGGATIRVDANTDPATLALLRFSRDAQGRIRDVRGRFVAEGALINRSLTNAAGGSTRFGLSLRSLAGVASTAAGVLGRVGIGVAGLGAAAGTAAPLLAGIVTTLQNIAPAGAVAVTGMLAIQQASAVVKLGMVGMDDAISAALDPSKAAEFSKALEKLAPNARAFAVAVRDAQPALQALQQGVQNRLFANFGGELERLGTAVLPVVRTNLNQTATTLNGMALGVSVAARRLATNGALGQAMAGANKGLLNLRRVPGQVVTALGQLAAAGAPAFDRITAAAGRAASGIGERLGKAFESGALERAVNTAIDVLKDLGTVGANIFATLGNIMAPVQDAGGGLVGVLKEITGALRDATGTQGFQQAIGAVAQVMGTLARTVGPLLGQALAAIGPIFTALGPPVERLITNLGTALSPIITALGPVLGAAATAVGVLVDAVSPLLPVIGNLIASLLPPLVPLLQAVGDVFRQAGPVVQLLGQTLAASLAPILAQLPALITPLATHLSTMARTIFPLLSQTIVQLSPSLTQIGVAFGQLLVAAGPLITVLTQLTARGLASLITVLTPVINLAVRLAAVLATQLSSTITNLVIPTLNVLTALLRGDFSGAWRSLGTLFDGVRKHLSTTMNSIRTVISSTVNAIVGIFRSLYNILIGNSIIPDLVLGIRAWFGRLPGMVFSALRSLASGLVRIATTALSRFRSAIVSGANATVSFVRGVPGRIRGALASLGSLIVAVAVSAFNRFRSSIASGAARAIGVVRGIPGRVRGALGGIGGLLVGAGRDLMRGMINGIRSMAGSLVSAAKGVVGGAVSGAKSALGISSPSRVFAEIGRQTGQGLVDGLMASGPKVAAAAKKLSAAASVTAGAASAGRRSSGGRASGGYGSAVAELQKLVDSGRWSKRGSQLFEDISFQGMSRNFSKQQMKIADGFWDAVAEIKKAVKSGKAVFEDMTFKGMSANVSRFHDMIAQIWKGNPYGGNFGDWGNFGAYGRYGKYAGGGLIQGPGSSRSDTVPILASPGEFMMQAAAVRHYGQSTMAALNAMRIPLGAVSSMRSSSPAAAPGGDLHVHVHNHGVIGSQLEVDNWLARSLDRLNQQRRLPKPRAV